MSTPSCLLGGTSRGWPDGSDDGQLGVWTRDAAQAGEWAVNEEKHGRFRQELSAPLTRALLNALHAGTAWSDGDVHYDPVQGTLRMWWVTLTLTPRVRTGVMELLICGLLSPQGR